MDEQLTSYKKGRPTMLLPPWSINYAFLVVSWGAGGTIHIFLSRSVLKEQFQIHKVFVMPNETLHLNSITSLDLHNVRTAGILTHLLTSKKNVLHVTGEDRHKTSRLEFRK